MRLQNQTRAERVGMPAYFDEGMVEGAGMFPIYPMFYLLKGTIGFGIG